MRTRFLLIAAVTSCAWTLTAQNASAPTPGSRVMLPVGSFIDMVSNPRCNSAGDVYIRPANKDKDEADEYLLAPIRQLTPEGKLVETYRLTDAGAGRGVYVTPTGVVYEASIASGGVYVVEFSKDGTVKSKTRLETGIYVDPLHVAVFNSGRFLLIGESGKDHRSPYTAIFDADGRLVRLISESEDVEARTKAEGGDAEFTHNDRLGNIFVSRGDVTVGSDGNAYLLRGGTPMVYVISDRGDVLRKMRIGDANSDLAFRAVRVYRDRLAVALGKFGHIEVRLTNLQGAPIGNYHWDSDKKDVLGLACYDGRGFTFVTAASRGEPYMFISKP